MAMLTYRTPEEFAERFDGAPVIDRDRVKVAADGYLDAHGTRHCARMSSVTYRRLSESIDLHQIDPAQIRVPLTLAGADRDALVPAADVQALAGAVRGARFHLIKSIYGHDAFLKEERQIAAVISQFIASLDDTQ
jgi:homoserine O-acetyltransferase